MIVPLISNSAAYRYWRWSLILVSNFPSFIDVGRVWLSDGMNLDFDYNWIPGSRFGTTISRTPLGRVQRTGGKRLRTMEFGISHETAANMIGLAASATTNLEYVLDMAGENGELIVVPESGSSLAIAANTALYCAIDDTGAQLPRQTGGRHSARTKVLEIAP